MVAIIISFLLISVIIFFLFLPYLVFVFPVFFGAPYVPAPSKKVKDDNQTNINTEKPKRARKKKN